MCLWKSCVGAVPEGALFGIFTVTRKGLASGACVRITPQIFTTPGEVEQLVDAMKRLKA